VAEYLGIPQITQVIKEEISDGKITCESVIEGGMLVTEASLPVLFTAQRGLNEPRYASLPGIMKAKKKPIDVKTVADLGVDAGEVGLSNNKVQVVSLSYPPERSAVKMIEGESADEQASALVKVLKEEAKVI
jgi:electron transfer flavoprotein beta subunit